MLFKVVDISKIFKLLWSVVCVLRVNVKVVFVVIECLWNLLNISKLILLSFGLFCNICVSMFLVIILSFVMEFIFDLLWICKLILLLIFLFCWFVKYWVILCVVSCFGFNIIMCLKCFLCIKVRGSYVDLFVFGGVCNKVIGLFCNVVNRDW